jgi:uncharacterized membrane protein YfcA
VALANALSGAALRDAFAILILFVALELVRSTLHGAGEEDGRRSAEAKREHRHDSPADDGR